MTKTKELRLTEKSRTELNRFFGRKNPKDLVNSLKEAKDLINAQSMLLYEMLLFDITIRKEDLFFQSQTNVPSALVVQIEELIDALSRIEAEPETE